MCSLICTRVIKPSSLFLGLIMEETTGDARSPTRQQGCGVKRETKADFMTLRTQHNTFPTKGPATKTTRTGDRRRCGGGGGRRSSPELLRRWPRLSRQEGPREGSQTDPMLVAI